MRFHLTGLSRNEYEWWRAHELDGQVSGESVSAQPRKILLLNLGKNISGSPQVSADAPLGSFKTLLLYS